MSLQQTAVPTVNVDGSAISSSSSTTLGRRFRVLYPPIRATEVSGALLAVPRSEQRTTAAMARAAVKRGVDIVLSFVLLVAVAPLFAALALAIKLDSPGPVFYRARRVGFRGRPMQMLKFRKMRHDAVGLALTAHGDLRFTRIGSFLAHTKLDELPQLWNVVRGDMSLIGPRPEDPEFVLLHADAYVDILGIRPGITGLSQVAFREESRILNAEDPLTHYLERILPQKMRLDRIYATGYRLRLDLHIFVWTFITVFASRPVAVHRETGRMNLRRRRWPQGDTSATTPTVSVAAQSNRTPV